MRLGEVKRPAYPEGEQVFVNSYPIQPNLTSMSVAADPPTPAPGVDVASSNGGRPPNPPLPHQGRMSLLRMGGDPPNPPTPAPGVEVASLNRVVFCDLNFQPFFLVFHPKMHPLQLLLHQNILLSFPDMPKHLILTPQSIYTPFLAEKRPFFDLFWGPKNSAQTISQPIPMIL